jgi:hypothetical protein
MVINSTKFAEWWSGRQDLKLRFPSPEPGCPSALRIFPNEFDTGTDSVLRVDNLWRLFFNRRSLESWRMIFRINLAMLRRRIWDSTPAFFFCRFLCLLSFLLSVGT